jgi:hypothetical protein
MSGFGGAEVHFGDTQPEESIQPEEKIVGLVLPTQMCSSYSESDSEEEVEFKIDEPLKTETDVGCKVRTFFRLTNHTCIYIYITVMDITMLRCRQFNKRWWMKRRMGKRRKRRLESRRWELHQ